MINKKSCTHKYGFKEFVWNTPQGKKIQYKKCKRCKKRIRIGEVIE